VGDLEGLREGLAAQVAGVDENLLAVLGQQGNVAFGSVEPTHHERLLTCCMLRDEFP